MFGVIFDLLSGRYVASEYNNRDSSEWPPHPARFFSALTSTWAEGEPESSDGQGEFRALSWLEQQDPPRILASAGESVGVRTTVSVFVPVNDASIVQEPDRSKLDTAISELHAAADAKARAKAEKAVKQWTKKVEDDTSRVVAQPLKVGKAEPKAAAALLPERRLRQARTFPCVVPEHARFAFAWDNVALPTEHRTAFQRLLSRVIRIGHSSSFVAARIAIEDELVQLAQTVAEFTPNVEHGDRVIRWVSNGQLERLSRSFEQHAETEPRVLPARFVRYSLGSEHVELPAPGTVFDPALTVFARVGGPRLSTISTAGLSRQFRRALMAAADQPVPELLSGHRPDGSPGKGDHIAIVPLPFVGQKHADGAILGLAIAFPKQCDPVERKAVLRAIARLERRTNGGDDADTPVIHLELGDSGTLELQRVEWEAPQQTLDPRRWTRPSRDWATATPMALDDHPGNLHDADPGKRRHAFEAAQESVRASMRFVAPELEALLTQVDVLRSCVLPGNAKPRDFPRFPIDRKRPQRILVHLRLRFVRPVQGPLLIGTGRFMGLGLCLPLFPPKAQPLPVEHGNA